MRSLTLKIIAFGAVPCAAFAVAASGLFARADIIGDAREVFETAFASKVTAPIPNPILRVRTGTEMFCIESVEGTRVPPADLIDALSDAFELGWKTVAVADLADCPAGETTFYVLQGQRPSQSELLDLIEGIVGSRPPDPDAVFPPWALGLSVSLPGPGHREFVFASETRDMPQEVARSILSEELLQSILRASDVPATEIVSLLGEDQRNTDYAQWFHHNPIGFCSVDVVLLELLLGPSTAGLHKMEQMRAHLSAQGDALLQAAAARAPALAAYSDSRCWGWEDGA